MSEAAEPGRDPYFDNAKCLYFDNAKFLAVALVVVGHAWEPLEPYCLTCFLPALLAWRPSVPLWQQLGPRPAWLFRSP